MSKSTFKLFISSTKRIKIENMLTVGDSRILVVQSSVKAHNFSKSRRDPPDDRFLDEQNVW